MVEPKPRGPSEERRDPDGVRIVPRDGKSSVAPRVYQGLALVLASASLAYIVAPRKAPSPPPYDPRPGQAVAVPTGGEESASSRTRPRAAAATPSPNRVVSSRPIRPRRTATPRPVEADPPLDENDLASYAGAAESLRDVKVEEYIGALHDAGIHSGLGAFPPPGTRPPLEGVAVPEDFEIPEGYVRHFQTTDDGQPIEPILMYSPDYEFLDADGNPVEIPADRVVPPEHVPDGLDPRVIDVPEPRQLIQQEQAGESGDDIR